MKATRHLFKAVLLRAGLAVFGCSITGFAATVTVSVNNFAFAPVSTNINVGDQVTWVWNSADGFVPHNTTSDTLLWNSPTNMQPFSFSYTFNSAGVYPYHCSNHVGPPNFMIGSITVQAANLPPTVSITNPITGTVFAEPANVTIQALASDSDGTVTNVQFLVGVNVLTNEAIAPFFGITNNLAAGSYTLSAIASDNSGATATNQVTISVVTPVTIQISAPQPVPPGKFRFTYTANAGLNYIVQSSTNLALPNWTTLVTNMAAGSSINFTDLNATFNPEFYRVGRLPNP